MTVLPGGFDAPEQPRRRRPGGPVFGGFLVVTATLYAAFALWRLVVSGLFDWDGISLTIAGLALTPYVVAAGLLLTVFVAVFRRWGSAVVVFSLSLALALTVLPRYIADAQPGTGGPVMRLLAVNMYYGRADADAVVSLARERAVDVLAISEMTPEAAAALQSAGLSELLPHRHFQPGPGASGSGVASRHPLDALDLTGRTTFAQPSVALQIEEQPVEVVAVHSMPPVSDSDAWRSDLRSLPRADKQGAVRILAGDFNATLDHAEFRRLLNGGYVDAADLLGKGLATTWPSIGNWPPVTLDHVLIDSRAAVRNFQIIDVPGSDHRAVLVTVRLPGSVFAE
ncbi:endonuclease/exonuclease/phosphatase family protein [Thermocrispum municipale]|uniref:endonuclease/exonuclease/phosphatase family protein n=1 Tax=Thermocrispum municipale TaxID=37926 RepID=UPI001FE1DB21|nr:endonuclease/exonuclease/phosphatase family protein [Thermocrispum municipale]